MKGILACFFAALLCVALAQTAAICSSNDSCNTYATKDSEYCDTTATDPLAYTCKARSVFDFKTSQVDSKGMCRDSLNFGVGNTVTCGAYAAPGCAVADADLAYLKCVRSTYSAVDKKCVAPTTVDITYKAEGERCDYRMDIKPLVQCGNNLVCIQHVCRPTLKEGDQCLLNPIGCAVGLICDGDLCVKKHSLLAQAKCKSGSACKSGSCVSGRCQEERSIPCFTNSQCNGYEVCYVEAGKVSGFCTSSKDRAHVRLDECIRENCITAKGAAEPCEACVKYEVEEVCADHCYARPDKRTAGDGYIYNCQTMKRDLITDCATKATVLNCPTVPIAGAFFNGISMIAVIVAMIFFL